MDRGKGLLQRAELVGGSRGQVVIEVPLRVSYFGEFIPTRSTTFNSTDYTLDDGVI